MACDAMDFESLYAKTLKGALTVKTEGDSLTLTAKDGKSVTAKAAEVVAQ
jgi:heat shock protein HslJ